MEVAIIGAGIVGLATGLQLVKRFPGISLAVLDKEAKVAGHQSGHNSGVIHSGIYYKPGSLKARLCLEGAETMIRFCKEHGVPYELCGKLIVATREDELQRLQELYRRGEQNGLKGLEILSAEQITEYEPTAAGIRAIRVAGTGIVDFAKVTQKYAELITASGEAIYLSHEVTGLKRAHGTTVVETSQGSFEAKLVINCAGLQSDRVSRMANASLDLTIVPFRGEYYDLVPGKENCLRGLLYPVPDPQFPFLGVHFTRRIGGGIEAGPNAVLALEREGYTKTSFRFGDVLEYARFPGFWIMARRHWRMSMHEYHRSWSKASFVQELQRLMPNLTPADLIPGGAGVRAQALDRQGRLIDDFRFVHTDGMVHVCNAPSPAATASLVIGRYIVDTVVKHHAAAWAS
ncbi:L-2-hydroxyglutarate oxidase [Edaphobacter paludis]|uniref:L-2-hydroxyglutarate oxidase n=1 Tax=Edaphobacter paludis TaxID=3035702 RepID=A0AAU7D4I4_9BACT